MVVSFDEKIDNFLGQPQNADNLELLKRAANPNFTKFYCYLYRAHKKGMRVIDRSTIMTEIGLNLPNYVNFVNYLRGYGIFIIRAKKNSYHKIILNSEYVFDTELISKMIEAADDK